MFQTRMTGNYVRLLKRYLSELRKVLVTMGCTEC